MSRVVFLGTPDFALPTLRGLLHSPDFQVVGVVTQPDRPAGRGNRLTPPPIKSEAVGAGIEVFQPRRIRNNPQAMEFLQRLQPDVMVVVAYGQILPASFFSYPRHGSLNVHASLLPKYRGAAPIMYALLNGDPQTGVTIMKIAAGLDAGDMLSRRAVEIAPDETAGQLTIRLAEVGASLLVETLPKWIAGQIQAEPQDDDQASHAPRVEKHQAEIDWARSALHIHNQIRAFNPWPGASTHHAGCRLKVWRSIPGADAGVHGPPGKIVAASEVLSVACGDGRRLDLLEVQLPGRRRMAAADFIHGNAIRLGEFLR